MFVNLFESLLPYREGLLEGYYISIVLLIISLIAVGVKAASVDKKIAQAKEAGHDVRDLERKEYRIFFTYYFMPFLLIFAVGFVLYWLTKGLERYIIFS